VIKADLKDSLKVLSDLFKDMKLPAILERRIIESFLYANETVSSKARHTFCYFPSIYLSKANQVDYFRITSSGTLL
jgi:hypothetical protein